MIDEADRDGDGEVSQDEFLRIMKKTSLYWKCSNYKTENSEFKNLENISSWDSQHSKHIVLYFLYFVFFSFILSSSCHMYFVLLWKKDPQYFWSNIFLNKSPKEIYFLYKCAIHVLHTPTKKKGDAIRYHQCCCSIGSVEHRQALVCRDQGW